MQRDHRRATSLDEIIRPHRGFAAITELVQDYCKIANAFLIASFTLELPQRHPDLRIVGDLFVEPNTKLAINLGVNFLAVFIKVACLGGSAQKNEQDQHSHITYHVRPPGQPLRQV